MNRRAFRSIGPDRKKRCATIYLVLHEGITLGDTAFASGIEAFTGHARIKTERAVRFAEAVDGTTTTSLTTGSPILGTPTLRINSEAQAADPARPDGTPGKLCEKEPEVKPSKT
jgi:hypothetical protein